MYYYMCLSVCRCPQLVHMSAPMSLSMPLHIVLSTPMPMPLLFIQTVRSANCWRRSDALCWKYESPVVSLLSPLPLLSLISPLSSHSRLPPISSPFPVFSLSPRLWSLSCLLSPLAALCWVFCQLPFLSYYPIWMIIYFYYTIYFASWLTFTIQYLSIISIRS